ncbi:hypothetical protein BCR42DRAFT_371864 [Absidia repens]|uniref:Uncharacterized protein n=1 Tax=Absidia repens TaxID=90262 RepID=A0A1X2IL27_9FUNG|nr:hypothetical protein BCR42DRAFT_371864 [Absidia repens]
MLHNINKIATTLPKWDQAKTMDDVELTAPSLYAITHPHSIDTNSSSTTPGSSSQGDDEGNSNSMADLVISPPIAHSTKKQGDNVKQAQDSLYNDIRDARLAIDLFLNSQINECLDIVIRKRQSSMYHSMSYACLLAGTAILTYQREDIGKAIVAMKETYQLADKFRCRTWKQHLRGISKGHTIQEIKNMTPLQRHAELVYAETYLMKAGLQILYDQSLVLAIREAIKAYSAHGIYKSLEAYMLHAQAQAGKGVDAMADYGLDGHLVSGIAFGMAGFNLALSAVPDFILRLVELVGFQGDRTLAFWYCRSVGGWDDKPNNSNTNTVKTEHDDLQQQHERRQGPDEGLRRQFCDMILMGYNIVLSKMTHLSHVDQALGERVLEYHLQHYPNGMIFLALKGRQLATQRQLEDAKIYYQRSMDAQDVWPQLQDVARWELGTLALVEQDWRSAHEMFRILLKQNHWSKAVYHYLYATSLYMVALDLHPPGSKRNALLENVAQSMKKVTKSKQKIAGRSIFIEKFFARKSRKYDLQGNRLLFPDLEILLSIGALELMPAPLIQKNLNRINSTLKRLETSQSLYVHDDICLSHLLRATLYRFLLEIEEQQQQDTVSSPQTTASSASRQKLLGHDELRRTHPFKMMHRQSIQTVMEHAQKVQLDHWIYYFSVYERAQLLIMDEMYAEAKRELDSILKCTEKNDFNVGAGTRAKSKYSMENALILKCHSCLGYIAEVATKGSIVGQLASSASLSHRYRLHQQHHHRAGPSGGLDDHCLSSLGSPSAPLSQLARKNSL